MVTETKALHWSGMLRFISINNNLALTVEGDSL